MRQRKTQFVYVSIVVFLLWFSEVKALEPLTLEVKPERYPVELILEGQGGADPAAGPVQISSPTPGVMLQEGMVLLSAAVGGPVVLKLQVAEGAKLETLPELHVSCAYCQVKMRSLPIPTFLQGQRVEISGHEVRSLELSAQTVVVHELSAVNRLRIQAQVVEATQALISAKQVSVDTQMLCEFGGTSFEVKDAKLLCGEQLVLRPAKLQSDELLLNAQRATIQLKSATVSKLSLALDRLFAWFYADVSVGHWSGQVKQLRFFTQQDQGEFKRDAGYAFEQFVFLGDIPETVSVSNTFTAAVSKPAGAQPVGTPISGKIGPLRIGSGFYMKIDPQVSMASADTLNDEKAKQQSYPDATNLHH